MSRGRREAVLTLLRDAPGPVTVADVAESLGIHPNTARFHLEALVATGRAEIREPAHRTPGRPPQLFEATRRMDPHGPRRYRMLAEILTHTLGTSRDGRRLAVQAGHEFGRRLAASKEDREPGQSVDVVVEDLIDQLDDLGFAPELRPEGTLALRNCPFLELAEESTRIVCPAHLGLMRGVLESWNAPVTISELRAFVEPDVCLAHLTPVGATS